MNRLQAIILSIQDDVHAESSNRNTEEVNPPWCSLISRFEMTQLFNWTRKDQEHIILHNNS